MNTIASDRLYSDPRLKRLSRELGCPAKALGVLMWLWHGTQNLGLVVCSECDILDALPQGLRTPQKVVTALVDAGWLQDCGGSYRVIGNGEHVKAREIMSEGGKAGAVKRWGKKNGVPHEHPIPQNLATPSKDDGVPIASRPPDPIRSDPKEEERARDEVDREVEERPRIPAGHPDVQFFEADYRQRFGGGPLTKLERGDAANLIRQCVDSGVAWQALLETYARKFENRKGSLTWLKFNARDVIRETPGKSNGPKKTRAEQNAEYNAKRDARFAREEAEAIEAYNRERAKEAANGGAA